MFDEGKSMPPPPPLKRLAPPPPPPTNVTRNVDETTYVLPTPPPVPKVLNGYHKKKFDDGSVYEGNFMNGKPEGKGTMKYVGGASYIGEWHYGLREGEGTWNYPNGDSYMGSWLRGRMHGRGTLKKKDGMVIVGEWKNDRLVAELGVKEKKAKPTLEKPESFSKALFKWLLIAAAIIIPMVLIPIGIVQCQKGEKYKSKVYNNHIERDLDHNEYMRSNVYVVHCEDLKTQWHKWNIVYVQCKSDRTIIRKRVVPLVNYSYINSAKSEFIEDSNTGEKFNILESDIGFEQNPSNTTGTQPLYFNEVYPALPQYVKSINIWSGTQYYVKNFKIRD